MQQSPLPKPLQPLTEVIWKCKRDQIILSPQLGGRVISWKHGEQGELIKALEVTDGGLLRVLLGEEKFPGTSYVTPHLARVLYNDERGFSIHLRHLWNASNAIARLLDWNDKVNPCYLDGLLLDKIVKFDAHTSSLLVDLTITNLTGEVRHITPWLQNHFHGWVDDAFVMLDGQKQNYVCHEIFWDGHRVEPGKPMRLIHTNKDGSLATVLGAATEWLAGMASLTHVNYGAGSTDGCMELRGRTITLTPNQRWHSNAFVALCEGMDAWQRWATDSPEPLFSRIESAHETNWDAASLISLLPHWALPEEKDRGLMVLSPLDKVPFTAASRYAAANSFAHFHVDATGKRARGSVMLFTLHSFESVEIKLSSGGDWQISHASFALKQHELSTLVLEGPADLAGKSSIEVRLSCGEKILATLRVEPDATVTPHYAYQVKQASTYLDERWRSEKSGFHGSTPEEFQQWQSTMRRRLLQWVDNSIMGSSPLDPRVVERQVGPRCIREKILLQTEPGVWVPTYLIRPRNAPANARLPAILFLHGSGPGKICFAPDETLAMYDSGDQWPSTYQLAHQLGCLVLVPDLRGFGEWSEANHGHRWQRAFRAGYDVTAMMVWDQMRAVDYLRQRPDVDESRIVSMGSSGGGRMTLFLLGADVRVAGGIVSSWAPTSPSLPDQYFYQLHPDESSPINPPAELPFAPATILSLAAPRALWVMDGRKDGCYCLPTLPHTAEEARAAFARWHADADAGREEIGRAYRLLGVENKYRSSWFEGGHLAGFTFNHIAEWLKQNFPIDPK